MGVIMYPLFTVYIGSIIVDRTNVLNFIKKTSSSVKSTDSSADSSPPDSDNVADSE